MFPHSLQPPSEIDMERAREFVVTEVGRVIVPGLQAIERVWIDGQEIAVEETRNFAFQDPGKEVEMRPMDVPILAVEHQEPDGTCLVRSVYSNDGRFQLGSKVMILGEWDDAGEERFVSSRLLDDVDAKLGAAEAEAKRLAAEAEVQRKRIAELEAGLAARAPIAASGSKPKKAKG